MFEKSVIKASAEKTLKTHQNESESQNENFEGKRRIVEIIKEGTNIWLQQTLYQEHSATDKNLDYYLSVEYEVLKRNSLKTLLPVQLREKDGEKSLLFDITGRHPLKEQRNSRTFSQKECKNMVCRIIDLLEEVDGYMLNLNSVQFQIEYIYVDVNGQVQWAYSPQPFLEIWGSEELQNSTQEVDEDFQKKIESFLAWMLTQINYEDTSAVRFMYELYNKVRKVGFSKELLERFMQSELLKESYKESHNVETVQENVQYDRDNILDNTNRQYQNGMRNLNNMDSQNFEKKKNINNNTSRKNQEGLRKSSSMDSQTWNGIRTSNSIERQYSKELDDSESICGQKRKEIEKADNIGRKRQRNLESLRNRRKTVFLVQCLRIIFTMLFILSLGLEGVFIFSGTKQGFSDILFQYCVGGALLLLTFLFGIIWSSSKIKKLKKREKFYIKKDGVDRYCADKYYVDEGKNIELADETINRPLTIKTSVDWEDDEERITTTGTIADTAVLGRTKVAGVTTGTTVLGRTEATEMMATGTTILGGTEATGINTGTTILGGKGSTGMTTGTTILDGEDAVVDKYFCPMLQEVDTGIVYIIKKCPFYIGSAIGVNQLEIRDKTVSREHAVILEDLENNYEGYIIRDMNSTNGTWINNKKIKKGGQERLEEGQIIRFAQKEYKFLLQGI